MGPGREEKEPKVIIPETGAGKYWYVDPRALGIAGSSDQAFTPQQALFEKPEERAMNAGVMDAMSRLFSRSSEKASSSEQPYDPMEQVRNPPVSHAEHDMGPEDVFKTVGIKIGSKEMEVPAMYDNMTDEDRNIIQYLPHTQWPKRILQRIEETARDNLEQGNDVYGNPIGVTRYGF